MNSPGDSGIEAVPFFVLTLLANAFIQESLMRRTELTRQTAKSKGYAALGSAAATTFLALMLSPAILVAGGPVTLWLTYRWLKYRAEWGLRF